MRLVLALLGALVAAPASAQQNAGAVPPSPANDDCLTCHNDPEAKRADGRSVAVDPALFTRSVHGQLELKCVDCHADPAAAELPHPEKLAPVDCATCHDAAVTAFKKSSHSQAREAGRAGATCVDCHGTHDILPSKDQDSRTYHLKLAHTCGSCHGGATAKDLPGGNIAGAFHDSIHGRALDRAGLLVAPSCASCHGAHDILGKVSPDSRVHRSKVPEMCGTCHEGVKHTFDQSIHGQMLAKGDSRAPVCINCHTAHSIQRAQTDAFHVGIVDSACGGCHVESLHTYRDTFHGQVTELGFSQVATCADCHGAHEQHPQSDPRSLVSAEKRLATCQKCHAGANAKFAQYDPHANAHDHDRGALLFYSSRFMQLLLLGVFGFFSLHTGLWFVRSLKAVRDRQQPVPRHEETDESRHS